MAVEAADKASSNSSAAERGVASGRSSTEFTAFVSNLPFNISVDELREKFKHVSNVHVLCSTPHTSDYSVVILLTFDWLKSIFADEHVNLLMWNFSLR